MDVSITYKEVKKREKNELLAAHAAKLANKKTLKDDREAFTVVIRSRTSVLEGEKDVDDNVKDILVPKNIDVLLVEQEVVGDDRSAIQAVVSANEELVKLREEVASLQDKISTPNGFFCGWRNTCTGGRKHWWLFHKIEISSTQFASKLFISMTRNSTTTVEKVKDQAKFQAAKEASKSKAKGNVDEDETISEAPSKWKDYTVEFHFPEPTELTPPLLQLIEVSFSYPNREDFRLSNVDVGIDMGTRVAIVGPNGAGKSTLLNLIAGDLVPTEGQVRKSQKLRIGRYSQYFVDLLTMEETPVQYLFRLHPEQEGLSKQKAVRAKLGKRIHWWSYPGQSRLEADISCVCDDEERNEIWVVENGTVAAFPGTFEEYKEDLQREIKAEVDD
ncbi:hypothetical protein Ddye_029945 [Dipteronia dyeriana]|uniref:ABC transporter domain-containing protein n=1 Tax=Dipteronia dyeriana TaxID=168575 RepID=A0AAD9TGH0_9ROSI|nr:hypothetical protein Ddye_029945 [Dipteronia dyeriana]